MAEIIIDEKAREYLDSFYDLIGIGEKVDDRIAFLKKYTGYETTSADNEETELIGLEHILIGQVRDRAVETR